MAFFIDNPALEAACAAALEVRGYGLVALEFKREAPGWVLRVFIERLGGEADEGITLDDCARASSDLSAALDVADLIPHAYHLEVSSPGIHRPLTKEGDFLRFQGQQARLRTREKIEGRRNFLGTIGAVSKGQVAIVCEGMSYEVPLAWIAQAHLEGEVVIGKKKENA